MKKSTIALLVCFVFALGMVYTPSAEAGNGDLLAQIISKIKAVVEKIKENKACKANPESCVEPPQPPGPIVIPEPQPASPYAFGEPSAALRNPASQIQAIRGVRSGSGWTEQTRSEVLARNGVVTTSSGHAAAAGLEILMAGGNAIDAAVATMGMIALTESQSTGIGADMFAIIYDAKTKQLYQISANSPAPKNYNRELFAANGQGVDSAGAYRTSGSPGTVGIWSAMIPGAIDGWDKMLKRFGSMEFKQVLEPARKKAVEGFPVEEIIAGVFNSSRSGLCNGDPDTAAVLCPGGDVPAMYSIFKNPDMGRTFQVLQEQGVDGFYRGEVAQAAVAKANSLVVLPAGMTEFWQLSDFADYEAKWVEPLTTNYRGYDLYETPPPSQGWAALEMMNIIEVCAEVKGFNLREIGRQSPLFIHFMVEAKKLAYSDLLRYNADTRYFPELNDLLPQYFLNKEYAYSLCDLIDTETPSARPSDQFGNLPGGTIYGASADRWGNMVSFVFSVYTSWGSQITVPGYGFQFTSRGAMFNYDPNHPNTLEGGGKEPFITIIAGFIMKDGEPVMAIGNMGGNTQPLGHAQHFVNMIDYGYNIQASSDAARWDHSQGSNGTTQGSLSLDYYLYDAIGAQLTAWGHTPSRGRGVGGGYEAIYFKKDANEPEPTFGTVRKCEALGNGQALCSRVPEWANKPVNGVYRAGSDTLHKDASAMGW